MILDVPHSCQQWLVVPSDLSESWATDFLLSLDDRPNRDRNKRWSIDARLDNLERGNYTKTYSGRHTAPTELIVSIVAFRLARAELGKLPGGCSMDGRRVSFRSSLPYRKPVVAVLA